MNAFIIIPFIIGIILSYIISTIGAKRKIGPLYSFLLSIIISPLLAYFFVISSERLDGNKDDKLYKTSFRIAGIIAILIGMGWIVGLYRLLPFLIMGVVLVVSGLILTGIFDKKK